MRELVTVFAFAACWLRMSDARGNWGYYSSGGGGGGGSGGGGSAGSYSAGGVSGGAGAGTPYSGTLAADALKNFYINNDGANFDFGYAVEDAYQRNFQSRKESSTGNGGDGKQNVVRGSYTVMEADGSTRTVEYEADWQHGFRATVRDKNGVKRWGYDGGNDNSGSGGGGGGNYNSGSSGSGGGGY